MAEVFRAIAHGVEGFKRVFVVKRIHKDKSAVPALREMFIHEARLSALLNHPNIVQVYDFGILDGCYFISMEYLRGKDLLLVLRQLRAREQAMPPSLAAYVARDVAAGLGYAHALTATGGKALEIVHRDVSPSNIMLLRTGGVKLLDFGIAKTASLLGDGGSGQQSGSGLIKGKLSYLSPEQVRNEPVDARSDIFSLGVVLWECLTGKRLFFDRADYHTMNNVLERPIPPPSTQRAGVPAALDFIVMRALEREPDHRYQSAQTLAQDLDHFLVESRFTAAAVPRLLDDLFGPAPSESDTVPTAAPPPEAALSEGPTPVLTTILLDRPPPAPAPMGENGWPARSEGLLPATSSEARRAPPAAGNRRVSWVAAGAAVILAFAAGALMKRSSGALSMSQPRAAPASSVSVRIDSDPLGAAVYDDQGRLLGHTPTTSRVPASQAPFAFTVRMEGYAAARHSVVPDRDMGALVTLRPEPRAPAARVPDGAAP
jgi:serine/threonine-protein kinase